jgi:hypothetical protein
MGYPYIGQVRIPYNGEGFHIHIGGPWTTDDFARLLGCGNPPWLLLAVISVVVDPQEGSLAKAATQGCFPLVAPATQEQMIESDLHQ